MNFDIYAACVGFACGVAIPLLILWMEFTREQVARWRKRRADYQFQHAQLLQVDNEYAFELAVRGQRAMRKAYSLGQLYARLDRVRQAACNAQTPTP